MMSYLLVAIGSGLGGILRYALHASINAQHSTSIPWETMGVNILGSVLLGFLSAVLPLESQARLLLAIGFCGGFTTFSTFSMDTVKLLQTGQVGIALAYVLLSTLVCIMMAFVGFWLGNAISS